MKTYNKEFYGDDVRWFVANVIDATPPHGYEGRVKIRIHGIHSGDVNQIPQKDLPWAQVMLPSDTYGVSGLGTIPHIQAGAIVFGFFLDGINSQVPLIVGSLPHVEYPTSVQSQYRMDPATNPFAYYFQQTNAQMEDPIFETEGIPAADVARYFIDNGFNAKQASSITGVLQTISGLSPTQEGNGFGIAGWPKDSARYARFNSYIKRLAPTKTAKDFDGQLLYVLHELQTTNSTALSKILRAREIEGSLYGEKIDGIEEKGNGQVAALVKYYVHPLTTCSKGAAEGAAKGIYGGLGAR
jgi:hypothetical protein